MERHALIRFSIYRGLASRIVYLVNTPGRKKGSNPPNSQHAPSLAQYFRPLLLAAVALGLVACSWMGPNEAEIFMQKPLLTKSQTQTLLGQGIAYNSVQCPSNTAAAQYAIYIAIPVLIDRQFYLKSSVEVCAFLLGAVPCSLDLDSQSNPDFFVGLYGTIIRNCGLKDMGSEQVLGQP